MTKTHHLRAHWVDEDEVTDPTHHHLIEHWVDEVDEDQSTEDNPVATSAS
jgi:hypothetical protein